MPGRFVRAQHVLSHEVLLTIVRYSHLCLRAGRVETQGDSDFQDFPGTSGICIRIHTLWALITIPGIKAICFIKGKGGFRKIFKTFLYFSLSPFPPLFCEGFAVVLCEFIGFIIWVTEATVSVRENWLLFPNVMYLIFFQQRWPSPAPLGSYVIQKWAPQLECEKPSHTNLGFDICSKGHLK